MFELVIDTRKISVKRREKITAGSVGIEIQFEFSSDWEGLSRTAVFETDKRKIAKFLSSGTSAIEIPWEICEEAGLDAVVGIYGTDDAGRIVIPTVYAKLGTVSVGATRTGAENAKTPTASDVQQIMAAAANAESIALSVQQRADAGEFDGSDCVLTEDDKTEIAGQVNTEDILIVGTEPRDKTQMVVDPEAEEVELLTRDDLDGLYVKPADGIPESDLASDVRAKLDSGGGASLDVQIDGESIVSDGVANIVTASYSNAGVVKTSEINGIGITSTGRLVVSRAKNTDIDNRSPQTDSYKPITANMLDYAVKAALCDGRGVAWTDDEQAAAQARLGLVSALGVGF